MFDGNILQLRAVDERRVLARRRLAQHAVEDAAAELDHVLDEQHDRREEERRELVVTLVEPVDLLDLALVHQAIMQSVEQEQKQSVQIALNNGRECSSKINCSSVTRSS